MNFSNHICKIIENLNLVPFIEEIFEKDIVMKKF